MHLNEIIKSNQIKIRILFPKQRSAASDRKMTKKERGKYYSELGGNCKNS